MRDKVHLAWGIVLVLVMQLALRSAVPVLAVRPSPVAAGPPALGLSDLAVTAPDDPSSVFALPSSLAVAVPERRDPALPVQRGVKSAQVSGASDGYRIHTYFVPFDDRNLWELFEGKASCHRSVDYDCTACAPLDSSIFVTAGADDTIYYYDHFEDGYDVDPLSPMPGAGLTATVTGTLAAGETKVFSDSITPGLVGETPFFGGRDRITILGEDVNVVRLANAGSFSTDGSCPGPSESGTWLAAAWEVLEVADWGTEYHAAVGQDLQISANGINDHDYAGLEVMASQDGTTVFYETVTGTVAATVNAGESYLVLGVDSTDNVTATAPVQVQMMTGACSTGQSEWVSAHGYTLIPENSWGHEYWAPVPGFAQSCNPVGQNVDTDIYLHNPADQAISVTVTSGVLISDVSIPAMSTVSVLTATHWTDLATGNQGTHMSSAAVFWGVVVIDSATQGATPADDWDWGHSLVPKSKLSSQVVVGYAPGRPEGETDLENGNPAFVVAVTDTVIYVDLDQDGAGDRFDMNGDGDSSDNNVWGVPEWNESISYQGVPVRTGQVLRVGDPVDYNLNGARIYTKELREHIAAVWGQDACRATRYTYDDRGYTILPLQVPHLLKTAGLAADADGSGSISPGDTLTYTLVLYNNGMGTMNNVVLTDSLPYTYTDFVVGSLQVTTPPPTDTVEYYDGSLWGTTPVSTARELRITWPYLGPTQTVTITFRAVLSASIPATVTEVCNQGVAGSANTDPVTATVCTPLQRLAELGIAKSDDPDPVGPGSPDRQLMYTLVYSNSGPSPAENVVVTDTLPPEVSFVGAVPTPESGPNPLRWNLGTLDRGVTGTITVAVTVHSWVGETFTNTVHIATDTPERRYDNNRAQEPTDVATDLAIEKLDWPDPTMPGGPLTYTLVYTNSGPFDAQEVYITDTLPAEATYRGMVEQPAGWGAPSFAPGSPATLTWFTLTLAAGASGRMVYTVTVAAGFTGTITNSVCISTTTPETRHDNNCDLEPTLVTTDTPPCDLEILKSDDPDPVGPDDDLLVYTLTYTNYGPAAAEGVVVTDTLPPGTILVSANPVQDSGPNPLLWRMGTLVPRARGEISVTLRVQPWAGDVLTNTVCIGTDTPEPTHNNCAQETTQVATDVAINKRAEPIWGEPGKLLAFTLDYNNYSQFDARDVYITDTFPIWITYTGSVKQPAGWRGPFEDAGPPVTLTWYTPTLAAGVMGTVVYTVTADPNVPEWITNTVHITTTTHDARPWNNWSWKPTSVRLLYFRATPLPGMVLLEWETAWEVDTYGFALLRGTTGRLEDAGEIAFVLAAGHGGGGGAVYNYRDRGLEVGPTYSYWLAEVDTGGRRTVYHPVTAAALPGVLYRMYLPLILCPF